MCFLCLRLHLIPVADIVHHRNLHSWDSRGGFLLRSSVCLHPLRPNYNRLCRCSLRCRTARGTLLERAAVLRQSYFALFFAMPHRDPWTAAEEALLGTAPDPMIAKRLRRTRIGVTQRRSLLKIAAFGWGQYSTPIKWGITELSLLGRYPDKNVAKITGRSLAEVKAKRLEIENGDR